MTNFNLLRTFSEFPSFASAFFLKNISCNELRYDVLFVYINFFSHSFEVRYTEARLYTKTIAEIMNFVASVYGRIPVIKAIHAC